MPRPNKGATLKWIAKRRCFYIVWYEAGSERVRSTGTADGREAEDALATFIRDRRRNERVGAKPSDQVSIAEVLDLYGDQHAPNAADPARIAYAIGALLPFWGELMVSQVTKQRCRDYAAKRGRATATIRRELGALRAALNFAVTEQVLESAPFVLLPSAPAGKDRWLTRSEAAALLNAARTARSDVRLYLPLFIVIALYTGARKEAVLSLRWPQVDLRRGRIDFGKEVNDDGELRDRAKSNKGRSHIPIPRRLKTFLRLARKRGDATGYVIHDSGKPIIDIGGAWNGNTDPKIAAQGSFGNACKRAGLLNVTPHTLRHTCGTWMAQRRVPLFQIGGWLGHSDERTTRLYAHHHPDYQGEALAALDQRT